MQMTMGNLDALGSIEQGKLEAASVMIKEKLESFNKSFTSQVKPESGIYGVTETVKDNGVVERIGINELGHKYKEYYNPNGQLYQTREILGNGRNVTTHFDDKGIGYYTETTMLKNNLAYRESQLTPNVTVTKGNFTAKIDAYGRPVLNKITDLSVKETGRESLDKIKRNDSYRLNDQKGHLIPDKLGGPVSQENIIPQLDKVNDGKIKKVENLARNYKEQGHTVDYEVKSNYSGTDKRPTSFEPKITADGKEVPLDPDLKKIYNEHPDELSTMKKVSIEAGEKFGLANELGLKNAAVAAGITMTVSSVENISSYIDGEITAEEMVTDIVKDTAAAGALAYGTTFISTAASQAMSQSSSALISSVGNSCLPAAVVSFGVASYDDISDFAQGKIDGKELAYNLGENAASVAGTFVGGAIGGSVGSVAGPVGTVAGSIVGGTVGCAIAVEAYQTAVERGAEGAEILANKAQELASNVVDSVASAAPEALNDVKNAFSDFAANVKLPFALG